MSTDTHSAGCKCWQCQGDPFAGIPQADDKPLAAMSAGAYLDVFAPLNTLEAAAWLEAVKQAGELVEATSPYEADWLGELDELRAEARRIFERKFFEAR